MNGAHDLGGWHGFGSIDRSQTANFAAPWEARVFALTLACGMLGRWNLDQARFAREQMPPADYLASTYYEHWLFGLELLLHQNDLLSADEAAPKPAAAATPSVAVAASTVATILRQGGPSRMPAHDKPAFHCGDRVTLKNVHPKGHTRAPRYIRGRCGHIHDYHGAHIFPDRHAQDGHKQAAHLYSVRFDATELWGEPSELGEPGTPTARSAVYVDVFEPYLHPPTADAAT